MVEISRGQFSAGRVISSRVAEFSLCRGILIFTRNSAEVEHSAAISTIFDLMVITEQNQTKLPKAVGPTNSYRNMAQSQKNAAQLDKLHF